MDIGVIRAQNLAWLTQRGFKVAPHLPTERGIKGFRSVEEIAKRLMALDALFAWVAAPAEKFPTRTVRDAAKQNDLKSAMTADELVMFNRGRHDAHANYISEMGWKLENMWALAWVIGFDKEPPVDGEMIDTDMIAAVHGFLPKLGDSVDVLMRRARMQPIDKVIRLEDRFYCCHNAVRAAQAGGKTVPEGFDPTINGAVIQERRHALTWCLSPGNTWDATDLFA